MRKNLAVSSIFILISVFLCFTSCMNEEHSIDQLLRGLKVTFDSNYEGGPSEKAQYLSISTKVNKILEKNSFVRTGYTFLGWSESADSDEVKYADESEVIFSNDKKLYAVWKENSYTIQFETNGGVIDTDERQEVLYNQVIELPTAEKEGVVFVGWYKDSNFRTKVVGSTVRALSSEDGSEVTIYARWVSEGDIVTVTYQSNYPFYESIPEKEDESKSQPIIPNEGNYLDENTFSVPGYKFTGWRNSETGETYADMAEVIFDRAVTLEAQWEPIHYTIVFNSNALIGRPVRGSVRRMSNVAYNSTEALNSPLTMTRDGYDFIFWSVNGTEETAEKIYYDSETGYDHKAGHLSTVDGATIVLYANWETDINGIEIVRAFTKYDYIYTEELDFSPVLILIHYADSAVDKEVSYNSEDFHYTMSYENGQVERVGENGKDMYGTGIVMTIYYGPGELFGAVVEDTFTINRATVDITPPVSKTYTYDRTEKVLVDEGSIINSVTEEEASDMHFEYSVNGGTYTEELPKATDADTYTVAWRVVTDADKENYYDLSGETLTGSFESTIEAAPLTLTWNVGEYTYNTQEQGPTAKIGSGVIEGDTVNVNVTGWQAGAGENLTAIASLTNSNYSITNPTQSYSIKKKEAEITAPTAKTLTYKGEAQTLLDAGSVTGGKIQYTTTSETATDFSDTIPSETIAGSYTVYWKALLSDTDNYFLPSTDSGSVTVTIEKKEATIVAPIPFTRAATNTALPLVNPGSIKDGNTLVGEIKYSLSFSGFSSVIPTAKDAGTYTVFWKAEITNDNYKLPGSNSGSGQVTTIIY